MEKSYFTFGAEHKNCFTGQNLEGWYAVVIANDLGTARKLMAAVFGVKWSMQYTEDDFNSSVHFKDYKCLTTITQPVEFVDKIDNSRHCVVVGEQELSILRRALDVYVRIGIGQVQAVSDDCPEISDLDMFNFAMNKLKAAIGFGPNANYGIHNPKVDKRFRMAQHMKQVISHFQYKKRGDTDGSSLSASPADTDPSTVIEIR